MQCASVQGVVGLAIRSSGCTCRSKHRRNFLLCDLALHPHCLESGRMVMTEAMTSLRLRQRSMPRIVRVGSLASIYRAVCLPVTSQTQRQPSILSLVPRPHFERRHPPPSSQRNAQESLLLHRHSLPFGCDLLFRRYAAAARANCTAFRCPTSHRMDCLPLARR